MSRIKQFAIKCVYIYYYIIFYSILFYSILLYYILLYYIKLYYIYLFIIFFKSIYIFEKIAEISPIKILNPHSSTSLLRVSPCFASKITPFRWHLPAPALSLPPALQTPVPVARRAPPKQRKRHRGGNRPGAARGQRRGG